MLVERFKKGMRVGSREFFTRWLVRNKLVAVNKRATARRGGLSDEALRAFAPANTLAIVDHDGDISYLVPA